MIQEKIEETLSLLLKVWTFLLIAVYAAGFMDAYFFPGTREKPLEGEEILWKVQKVLFFALMGAGFLVDVVRMRGDREKAFVFIFLSLLMGGFSALISAIQYKFIAGLFPG